MIIIYFGFYVCIFMCFEKHLSECLISHIANPYVLSIVFLYYLFIYICSRSKKTTELIDFFTEETKTNKISDVLNVTISFFSLAYPTARVTWE